MRPLDFTEARDGEWQWHQLGHMQVCTSLQADNHTSTSPLSQASNEPAVSKQQLETCHCRRRKNRLCVWVLSRLARMYVTSCDSQ